MGYICSLYRLGICSVGAMEGCFACAESGTDEVAEQDDALEKQKLYALMQYKIAL